MEQQEIHSFESESELLPFQKEAEEVLALAAKIIAEKRRELGLTGKPGENPLHNNMVWWLERNPKTFVLVDFFNDIVEANSPLEHNLDALIRGADPKTLETLHDGLAKYIDAKDKPTLH